MGVFGNFTKKVQEGGKGQKGEEYSLPEVLTALDMANGEVKRQTIADLLGRSKDSLNYKVFEKQTTIKGKTQCRSILKYLYIDHTKKGSGFVDEEVFLKRLFNAYGEKYENAEQVEKIVNDYCKENGIEIPEGGDGEGILDEATTDEVATDEQAEGETAETDTEEQAS